MESHGSMRKIAVLCPANHKPFTEEGKSKPAARWAELQALFLAVRELDTSKIPAITCLLNLEWLLMDLQFGLVSGHR